MLNPIALIRSASSRSTSSRFFHTSSSSKDYSYDSGSDISGETCMFNGSHQSTLDRLYAWEKKLYEEVKVFFFPKLYDPLPERKSTAHLVQHCLDIHHVWVLTWMVNWLCHEHNSPHQTICGNGKLVAYGWFE